MTLLPALQTVLILLALSLATGCQAPQIERRLDERIETIQASETMAAKTFAMQIPPAAQQYQIQQGKAPEGFTDFVTPQAIAPGEPYTLSVATLGRHGGCTVTAQEIHCPTAFTYVTVTYRWQPGGQATADVSPKAS